MSLGSIFRDAWDRFASKVRKDQVERLRSDGGTLGSTPASAGGAFEPVKRESAPDAHGDRVPPPGETSSQ